MHTKTFTHRNFYTEAFTQKKPLHRGAFTHRGVYTEESLHTEGLAQGSFYTQKLLHREACTHRSFYTKKPFTQNSFFTEELLPTSLRRLVFISHSVLSVHAPSWHSMLWWIVASDAISAHDVSAKILRRFRAEHSCPHHILKKRRAVPSCFWVLWPTLFLICQSRIQKLYILRPCYTTEIVTTQANQCSIVLWLATFVFCWGLSMVRESTGRCSGWNLRFL